jgi:hypothetical protein
MCIIDRKKNLMKLQQVVWEVCQPASFPASFQLHPRFCQPRYLLGVEVSARQACMRIICKKNLMELQQGV